LGLLSPKQLRWLHLGRVQKFRGFDDMQSFKSLSMRILIVPCLFLAALAFDFRVTANASATPGKGLLESDPGTLGLLPSQLANIDDAVRASIWAGEIPGAVVLIARHGRIAYLKAFGNRSVQPSVEAMTTDTIFDMSSLTKVMATTPSIMMLVESGAVRLEDRVKRYLPNFSGGGKDGITIRQLLTHYSGLPPDFDLSKRWFGHASALEELWKAATVSEAGKEFAYSDLNFIVLGEIVHAISGKTLDVFARERIYVPLGMSDTGFRPPSDLAPRIAPTETRRNTLEHLKGVPAGEPLDEILRGEVHDPTAWRMGGVAGHAGLFSTARDAAIYAQMLLGKGSYQGMRIFSPLTIEAMTSPESPRNSPQIRGYGWDIESSYSAPRGDLFKDGFGHSGFTGTSIWIDPSADTFVVVLTNRVHPEGGKDVNHLRAVIANIVAASIVDVR
jgi:CubicO group peptidase (beta-lactamase class C family)